MAKEYDFDLAFYLIFSEASISNLPIVVPITIQTTVSETENK